MTKQIQDALKMAIEALEFIKDGGFYTGMEANKALINREWVGLSDDEILIICAKMAAKLPNKEIDLIFARAIEQASKEKNT